MLIEIKNAVDFEYQWIPESCAPSVSTIRSSVCMRFCDSSPWIFLPLFGALGSAILTPDSSHISGKCDCLVGCFQHKHHSLAVKYSSSTFVWRKGKRRKQVDARCNGDFGSSWAEGLDSLVDGNERRSACRIYRHARAASQIEIRSRFSCRTGLSSPLFWNRTVFG